VLLAGGAGGRLQGGRHVACADGTPLTNLLLAILDKVDVHRDRLGDSTGRLTEV
jgi:molybdopterin-guanine dinucleotide biosynthesis protein A